MFRRAFFILSLILASSAVELRAEIDLENAVIIRPDTMKNWEEDAVSDLKTALEKVTGKKYNVLPEKAAPEDGVKIFVGDTRSAASAGISVKDLAAQEFQIKTDKGNLYLAGGTSTGTSYAVSFFLQRNFGVYQLDFDAFVFPENKKPVIREMNERHAPDIRDRDIYNLMLSSKLEPANKRAWHQFYRRNFLDWNYKDRITPGFRPSYGVRQNHTFFQYVPPAKYFKTNPEFYSMHENGTRGWFPTGQLCLSNKEMRKAAYDFLEELIKKERAAKPDCYPTLYELSQEDNTYYLCKCPECTASIQKYGGANGLLLEFVNEMAEKIAQKYPDVFLRTFAYCFTEQPVDAISPAPNVIVQYCDLYGYSIHMYPLTDPVNKDRYELYMKWVKKTPHLMLWDYILGRPAVSPIEAIISDAKLFKQTGLERIFVESEYDPYIPPAFRILQYFLQAQLLFDSAQDADRLISIFMDNYFEEAAPEMKAYLALLHKAQRQYPTPSTEWRYARTAHIDKLDFLSEARDLINKGLAKVRNKENVAGRVARELVGIDINLFKFYRNNPQKEAEFKALSEEYKAAMTLSIKTLPYNQREKAVLMKRLEDELAVAEMKFDDLPPEIADLPESKYIVVPYIYQQGYLHTKKLKDPDSSQNQSLSWIPGVGRAHGLPQYVGVYGQITKRGCQVAIEKAPEDEKYHWYKIGEVELDPDSFFYVTDWHNRLCLKNFYNMADGFDFNPNKYEAWISIKLQGPAYVPGSQKENAFLLDRGLLIKKY